MVEAAAIILAAGLASRFATAGQASKVLALHEGKSLVQHAAAIAAAARLDPRIIVAGRETDTISDLFGSDEAIRVVRNSRFREGLSTSIRCGLEMLPDDAEAVFILLADMPLVHADTLLAMLKHFDPARMKAVVPAYRGRPGNPCLLGRSLFPDLRQLTGDQGARSVLRKSEATLFLEVEDPGVLVDVDTIGDLERLVSADRSAAT